MNIEFPQPPKAMTEMFNSQMTYEQNAFIKLLEKKALTHDEIISLNEANQFFKSVFNFFQSLPLKKLSATELENLKQYIEEHINFLIILENKIQFNLLYRVTVVKEDFLEEGKVRNLLFLCCPPVEILKKLGLYNRASSPDATVFYASFHKNVALHEIKPQIGQRVIVTTWHNFTQKPFVSFPIANNEIVKDNNLLKSNKALRSLKENIHPLLFDRIESYLRFLSSEFVKSIEDRSPQRIEYFYSAFFGDRILNKKREISVKVKPENKRGVDMGNYDCILYPSVAFNHREANVAISPKTLIENLKPIQMEEFIVEETYYEICDTLEKSPIKMRVLRNLRNIKNGRLLWDDDEV